MIQDIDFVFASVASGEWTKEEFEAWCVRSRTVVDDAYNEGYSEGPDNNDTYHEGYNDGYDAASEDNSTEE